MPVGTAITNVTELQAMENDLAGSYYLANDIDASATTGWNAGAGFIPIGNRINKFSGIFDGDEHTITSLFIDSSSGDRVGLFGYIGVAAEVKNIGLINADITSSNEDGGILAGRSDGTITNAYTTGFITAVGQAGGLLGYNAGIITDGFSTGAVIGTGTAGGAFGVNVGIATNIYSIGTTGASVTGGLAAQGGGTYNDCFWDTETSGSATSDGGTGKTTAQMYQEATFTNWDFTTIWSIDEGVSYPTFLGDVPPTPIVVTDSGAGSDDISVNIVVEIKDTGSGNDRLVTDKPIGFHYNEWQYNKIPYNGYSPIIEEVGITVVSSMSSAVERADYIDIATQTFYATASKYLGYISFVDLKLLLPRKFVEGDENQRIVDYIDTCSELYNEIYSKIDDFGLLSNIDSAPVEYVRYLSEFIGFEGLNFPRDNDEELRKQLKWAIDWYKEKGLYKSINIALYLAGMSGTVYDMWTNNYSTFKLVAPEVTSYKSGYYKSPHLTIDVNLNKYKVGSDYHLMESERLSDLTDILEQDRPANNVFHISLILEAMTYGDHVVYTITDSGVATVIADDWTFTSETSDEGEYNVNPYNNIEYGGYNIAGYSDINKWKLGTGHVGIPPSQSWDDLETEVLNGTITTSNISDQGTYYLYSFEIASAIAQNNITELGLFNGTTPMLFATLPYLDKIDGTVLKIKVKVYK